MSNSLDLTYFADDLTDMQKLYCCITGYEGPTSARSAQSGYYFDDCKTEQDKVEFLDSYADQFIAPMTKSELKRVQQAIDTDTNSAHEQFQLFETLK